RGKGPELLALAKRRPPCKIRNPQCWVELPHTGQSLAGLIDPPPARIACCKSGWRHDEIWLIVERPCRPCRRLLIATSAQMRESCRRLHQEDLRIARTEPHRARLKVDGFGELTQPD